MCACIYGMVWYACGLCITKMGYNGQDIKGLGFDPLYIFGLLIYDVLFCHNVELKLCSWCLP